MRVLGIDPGSTVTGIGVVERRRGRLHLIGTAHVRTSSKQPMAERLAAIHAGLADALATHTPDAVAIESIFKHKSSESALRLGHARGVALLAAIQAGFEPAAYNPSTIKRTVGAHGRADKKAIARMVTMLLGHPVEGPADVTDAVAIAICHLNHARSRGLVGGPMIGRLTGTVIWRGGATLILDVRGVGYELHGPSRTLDGWAAEDGAITAIVSTQVREDAITLYAFDSFEERQAFHTLLGVNKVGAKLALATLDALDLGALHHAVESDDIVTLTRISGVGKRTAQRLALELKGKLPASGFVPSDATAAPSRGAPDKDTAFAMALDRLGWTRAEIEAARGRVAEAGLDDAPVGERIRHALKTSLNQT